MPNQRLPYNTYLKKFAREHRNGSTKAEVRLWCELFRNRKMLGYPFLRQRIIGNHIVDFYCKDLCLAIETDGFTHHFADTQRKDRIKEETLKRLGVTLLRFRDEDVMLDLENVRLQIVNWIEHNRS